MGPNQRIIHRNRGLSRGYNLLFEPISSFADDTPIDVINAPDNLLALCPNCHWEFDHPVGVEGNDPSSVD
jgi:hypothetical protein